MTYSAFSLSTDDLFIHNAAEPMSVSMESSLSLPCVVKAKNKQARNSVKFVWKRDGRILNNTRFSISNFSCKYEVLELLTINKIRKLDRGTYECHVEIGRTKLNTSWTIRVIDEHKSGMTMYSSMWYATRELSNFRYTDTCMCHRPGFIFHLQKSRTGLEF